MGKGLFFWNADFAETARKRLANAFWGHVGDFGLRGAPKKHSVSSFRAVSAKSASKKRLHLGEQTFAEGSASDFPRTFSYLAISIFITG